ATASAGIRAGRAAIRAERAAITAECQERAGAGGAGARLLSSGAGFGPGSGAVSRASKVSPVTTSASASTAAGQAFAVEGGTAAESTFPRAVGAFAHEVGVTTMPSCTTAP